MLNKSLVIGLAALLLSTAAAPLPASAQSPTVALQTSDKARAEVAKLGVNSTVRVEVKMRDKTKLRGHISRVTDDAFDLTDAETGATRTLRYDDVSGVKKPGKGLSPKAWIIIGAAGAAAVIVGVTVIKPVLCDGGAGC